MTTRELLHLIDEVLVEQDVKDTLRAYEAWDANRRRRMARYGSR